MIFVTSPFSKGLAKSRRFQISPGAVWTAHVLRVGCIACLVDRHTSRIDGLRKKKKETQPNQTTRYD